MADVFISYDRVEHDAAARIVQRLRRLNVDVWFDARVRPEEVKKSKVVLVCWTQAAIASEWVRGEALLAHREGKLLGCLLEIVALSPPFNIARVENLAKWSGQDDDAAWLRLLARIGERIGRPGLGTEAPVSPPAPPPAPRVEASRNADASRNPDAGRDLDRRNADAGRSPESNRSADTSRGAEASRGAGRSEGDRERGARGSGKSGRGGGESRAWKLLLGETGDEPPSETPAPSPQAPIGGGESAWDRLLGEPSAKAPSTRPASTSEPAEPRGPTEQREPKAKEPNPKEPTAREEAQARQPAPQAPRAPEPKAGRGQIDEPIISEPIVRGPSEGAPREDDPDEDEEPLLDIEERIGGRTERPEERLRSAGELRFSPAADKLGTDWFTGGSDELATFETPDRASGKWTRSSGGGGPKRSHLIAGIVVAMGVLVFAGAYFATDYFAGTPSDEFAKVEPAARGEAPVQKASTETAPNVRARSVAAAPSLAAATPAAPEAALGVSAEERRAWRSARAGGTRAQFQAYLTSFPDGAYASEAQSRLDALQPQVPSVQQPNTIVALMRDELRRLRLQVDGSDAALGPAGTRSIRQLQRATKMNVDGRPSRALLRRVAVLQSCHMERSLRDHVFRTPVRGTGQGSSASECCSAAGLDARNNVQNAGLGFVNPWSSACQNLSRLPQRRLAGPPVGEASDRGTYASCEAQDDPANPGVYSCAVTGEIACGYQARSGAEALVCE